MTQRHEWQIVLGGTGGQGLIQAGKILSQTATELEDQNATQRNFYGPEKRGGLASTEVRISTEEIVFPNVEQADVIVLLHQAAWKAYEGMFRPDTILIYDKNRIALSGEEKLPDRAYAIPLTDAAYELNAVQSLNIIALGALVEATKLLDEQHLLTEIAKAFPKAAEKNRAAFLRGAELIRDQMKP